MPFLLLLLLTLTYLQGSYPRPLFGACEASSIAITWGGMFAWVGLAAAMGQIGSRQLKSEPIQRGRILRWFGKCRRYHFFGMLGFYLLALYLLGWGWLFAPADAVHAPSNPLSPSPNMLPGLQILLLSPFLFSLVSSWLCFYDFERTAYLVGADEHSEPFLSRWSYLTLQVRHNLLLVIPPLVPLMLQQSLLYFYPNVDKTVTEVFATVLLVITFVTIPLVLRLILGLRPLPAGPLRTRLMQTAQRCNFRFSDILVWDSRRTMANAMVTGPLPFLRYVVLTDRLIESLPEEEIEAVFGHEMGHIKHQHMLFYLGFLLGSMVALAGLWDVVSQWLDTVNPSAFLAAQLPAPLSEKLLPVLSAILADAFAAGATLILIILVSLYVFVVFGFLSRRCERQADIYGCRTVSCEVFIHALEQVAYLNGIDRDNPGWLSSWQHSTIARRIAFIRTMSADPLVEPRFQRNLGILKWAVAAVIILTLVLLRDHLWSDVQEPSAHGPATTAQHQSASPG